MEFSDLVPLLTQGGVGNALLLIIAWFGQVLIGKITKLHNVFNEKLAQEKLNTNLLRDLSSSLHKQTFLLEQQQKDMRILSEKILELSGDTRDLFTHINARPKKKVVVINGAEKVQ